MFVCTVLSHSNENLKNSVETSNLSVVVCQSVYPVFCLSVVFKRAGEGRV